LGRSSWTPKKAAQIAEEVRKSTGREVKVIPELFNKRVRRVYVAPKKIAPKKVPAEQAFSETVLGRPLASQPQRPKVNKAEEQSIVKIIRSINRIVPVRLGRVYKKSAAAVYRTNVGVIRARTRHARDLRVLTHELGHHIDALMSLSDKQFHDELLNMPYVKALLKENPDASQKTLLGEGVADYFYHYFLHPDQAAKYAPELNKYFTGNIYKYPAVERKLDQVKNRIEHYRDSFSDNPDDRVRAYVDEFMGRDLDAPKGFKRVLQSFYDENRVLSNFLERYFYLTSDFLLPMEKHEAALKGIQERHGEVWKYGRFETSPGFEECWITRGQPAIDPETGTPKWNEKKKAVEFVGPSVEEIFARVGKLGKTYAEAMEHAEEFMRYVTAQAIISREDAGVVSGGIKPEFGLTLDKYKGYVRRLERTPHGKVYREQMGELFGYVDEKGEWRDGLRQRVYRATLHGAYSEEEITRYLSKYPTAIPMRRQWIESQVRKDKVPYSDRLLRKEHGADLPIVNPLLSLVREIRTMSKIYKTRLTNHAYIEAVNKFPQEAGKFIEEIRLPMSVTRVTLTEILDQVMDKFGGGKEGLPFEVDTTEMNDVILDVFRPQKFTQKHKNIVIDWWDGKARAYEVFDRDLLNAYIRAPLDVISPKVANWISKYISSIFRTGHIANLRWPYNNTVRDQQIAFAHGEYGYIPGVSWVDGLFTLLFDSAPVRKVMEPFIKQYPMEKENAILGIFKEFVRKEKTYMDTFTAMGGTMKSLDIMNEESAAKLLKKMMERAISDTHWRVPAKKTVPGAIGTPWRLIKAMVTASEMSTNIGQTKMAIRKGVHPLEATLAGKDITVDHNMTGVATRQLGKVLPFFRPVFHGQFRLYREMKDPKRRWKTMLKYFVGISLSTLAFYWLNKDNPNYQELPQWRKDWCINIPLGNPQSTDLFLPLPRPYGVQGWFFGTFIERCATYLYTQNKEVFDGWWQGMYRSLVPGFTFWPMVFAELIADYKFFEDRPIESQGDQYKKPAERYSPYSTEVSKLLGQTFNISPKKTDHALKSVTGHLGMGIVSVMDYALRAAGIADTTTKPAPTVADRIFAGPSLYKTRASGAESVNQFYNLFAEAQMVGDDPQTEHDKVLKIALPYMRSIANDLSDLRKLAQQVHDDSELTATHKRELLEYFDTIQINLVREFFGRETIPLRVPQF
ncbi:MAG: hypothetical protein PHI12_13970, partial [Dehalococcoidales bacterium]|nr:hypothetical protein [Dehalococcoidales bacterium]